MPLGGCSSRNSILTQAQPVHIWNVMLRYYELKVGYHVCPPHPPQCFFMTIFYVPHQDGKVYNESPARKLADSFGIPRSQDSETTVKHTLLAAIGHIIETHTPYQRSDDAHFKAFVSLALK